jgi:hypothetical protein
MSWYTEINSNNVNTAAFFTTIALGGATIGACFGAAAVTASTAATVAYGILAVLGSALSLASCTAWFDNKSVSVEKYAECFKKHSMVTIPATIQFIAQSFFHAMIQGISQAIGTEINRKVRKYFN